MGGRAMALGNGEIGEQLRHWRQRRRMSQLALAVEANISSRHLSFLETGRARPSREMIQHLAEHLRIPLRERNRLFLAAGFAPAFPERPLDDPALAAARAAIDLVLAGHEPYPAIAVDRHWQLCAANRVGMALTAGVAPALLEPPINVLRLSLHPEGLAPRILNLTEWRRHILQRLRGQVELSGDPVLAALHDELSGYPGPLSDAPPSEPGNSSLDMLLPLRLATDIGVLSLFGTVTVFGTPIDVTLSELAIEAFYPADAETAERLRALAAALPD